MSQTPNKSTSRKNRWWLLLLLTLPVAWVTLYEPWYKPRAILRSIEKITQVEFPKNYSDLEIQAATEFCYVGKMRISQTEMNAYLREMKFTQKADFLFLRTWGKYKEIFREPEKLKGFWSATGNIEGANKWEFAYNPATGEMWFVMLQELFPPETEEPAQNESTRRP